MTTQAAKISGLTRVTTAAASDLLLVSRDPDGNASSRAVSIGNVLANSGLTFVPGVLRFGNTSTPANSTITVAQGTVWADSSYIYVATANNVVKRAVLSTF
jgi:hypothetical protein